MGATCLEELPLVETVVYGEDGLYDWDDATRRAFELEVVREAVELHYANCPEYQRYCAAEGFDPSALCSPEDITRVPLVPTSLFKEIAFRSVDEGAVAKVCRSSGTQGSVSAVHRDDVTLERFVGSIRVSADQILEPRVNAEIFNLGPDTDEAGDVWFPYVMSLLALLRPARQYVVDGVFYPRVLVEDLAQLDPEVQPILVGPPILFLYLLRFLEEEGLSLALGARGGLVVTGGGWKAFTQEEVDRDRFVRLCVERLGLESPADVRDAFNMVELNTVLFECEQGIKHVPPWLVIEALDPETLIPVPHGEMGVLAFWDPLPTSYPGFVLSADFGKVREQPCSCGRTGRGMHFLRRVERVEGRGCALTMDRNTTTFNEADITVATG